MDINGSFDASAFDAAADKARQELENMLKEMTPEERKGAIRITHWFKQNFMDAGHKRLGRIMVDIAKNS